MENWWGKIVHRLKSKIYLSHWKSCWGKMSLYALSGDNRRLIILHHNIGCEKTFSASWNDRRLMNGEVYSVCRKGIRPFFILTGVPKKIAFFCFCVSGMKIITGAQKSRYFSVFLYIHPYSSIFSLKMKISMKIGVTGAQKKIVSLVHFTDIEWRKFA